MSDQSKPTTADLVAAMNKAAEQAREAMVALAPRVNAAFRDMQRAMLKKT